jgi:hypothetical protein
VTIQTERVIFETAQANSPVVLAVGSNNIAAFGIPFVIVVLVIGAFVIWKQSRGSK